MGQIETAAQLVDHASDSCDFTKPVKFSPREDASLEAMRAEWHRHARYHVTRHDGHTRTTTYVGHWLPHEEACAAAARLSAAEAVRNPHEQGCMCRTLYSIELHEPVATAGDRAAVGDLVVHHVVEPGSRFALSGTDSFRSFYQIGLVTAVDAKGRITAFTDRDGPHCRAPRKPWVVAADQVHVDEAMAGLTKREAELQHWGVQFTTPKNAVSFLERFIRHQPPVYPVDEPM